MRRGRRTVPGYDYPLFASNVVDLHGAGCWVRRTILSRDPEEVPPGLATCNGVMDAHHLAPKRLLKREFPHGVHRKTAAVGFSRTDLDSRTRTLADLLNDGRAGVLACRRHHDMCESTNGVDGQSFKLRRDELPGPFVEFTTELGLGWFLESRAFDVPIEEKR